MAFATKIYLTIISFLLVVIIGVVFAWQNSKNHVVELTHTIELNKAEKEIQTAREAKILAELNAENAAKISALRVAAEKAEQAHRNELNEIKARYDAADLANKRLRDQVRILNSQLSGYTRETVENYATTAANNTVECSAVTAELERLALEYNSEIERLRSLWPDTGTNKPTITVIDDETGFKSSMGEAIKIKAQFKDVTPVNSP